MFKPIYTTLKEWDSTIEAYRLICQQWLTQNEWAFFVLLIIVAAGIWIEYGPKRETDLDGRPL